MLEIFLRTIVESFILKYLYHIYIFSLHLIDYRMLHCEFCIRHFLAIIYSNILDKFLSKYFFLLRCYFIYFFNK